MQPSDFPSNEIIEDIALRRLKMVARRWISGPDLEQSLRLQVQMDPNPLFERWADDLVMSVIAQIYAEDLPPETVEQKTEIAVEGVEVVSIREPDGPWMRWRTRHQTAPWYRALLGWLPPIRHIHVTQRVPWSTTREVICRVDLSRFYAYPESRIGTHPGLGTVRVPKHQITAFWTDRPAQR